MFLEFRNLPWDLQGSYFLKHLYTNLGSYSAKVIKCLNDLEVQVAQGVHPVRGYLDLLEVQEYLSVLELHLFLHKTQTSSVSI